ncbi:precorrin-6A/cobalt-precorrin-6A reductase [Anaerosolibacter carboniphilus]|uniref:Precorrin-6A/cobalt-precorrin-6A reductase n=1 Tax=Anaerosolibacter carboniphilus TaxID=1417629 RepID=A0A841KUI6_9FIRM|nr:cobalt-precorrin-6A reductase [Anaerosolibacter carboniphilus]MBB6214592.1 precorrin-6A/cobalt-precorrin-6A reductase [Anaerosolibacter carboniphilus]
MIFVISGTQDGRELVEQLAAKGYPLIVSTATAYGASLIESRENCQVFHQRLNRDQLMTFMDTHKVKLLIDATHPYAVEVSLNAIDACKHRKTPYIRFERSQSDDIGYQDIIYSVESYEEAAKYLSTIQGNILLTTGSKTLEVFTNIIDRTRIFARVLPTCDVLKKCEVLGLPPSNIIAMQGPFSKNMNKEMMKKYNIQLLVTKDSGDIGGTLDKLEAAHEMEVSVVMIMRPAIPYPNIYRSFSHIMDKVSEII